MKLGPTRTMVEDAVYGVRQLVDVALKGLSPGINDPTTAQDAIFRLGTLLAERLISRLPALGYEGDDGRRLLMPQAWTPTSPSWPSVSCDWQPPANQRCASTSSR
ncbi:MAG: DUF2254 family protein [Actinomycetota bacterium]